MKILPIDDQKRIQIPDAKPRQVFSYVNNGDGTLTLAPVKWALRDVSFEAR